MSLDARIFTTINGEWSLAVLDWWSAMVRATEIWLVPAVAVLALCLWRGGPRGRGAVILVLLIFAVSDGLIVHASKQWIQRQRPAETLTVRSIRLAKASPRVLAFGQPLLIERIGPLSLPRTSRSFPSGHAWNAFAVATALAVCYGWRGAVAFLPAAAIAFARIHAGLHWPSDVVFSALLSVPVSAALALAFDRLWHAAHPRLARRLPAARLVPRLIPAREAEAA